MRKTNVFGTVVMVAFVGLTGCQAWPGANFPLQNATRVPPPGTGTYPVPSGYYNNNATSSFVPSTQTMQASNPSGLRPASGSLPTTDLAGGVVSAAHGSMVSQAGFATQSSSSSQPIGSNEFYSAASTPPVVPAAYSEFTDPPRIESPSTSSIRSGAVAGGASASLSDSGLQDAPSLQWQQNQ